MRLGESASMYLRESEQDAEQDFVINPSPTECDEIIVSHQSVNHFQADIISLCLSSGLV